MIHIKFLMNEIKFKIYYSNVRMYKNMMQAFIEDIHNAKNDTDVKVNFPECLVAGCVLLKLLSRSNKRFIPAVASLSC